VPFVGHRKIFKKYALFQEIYDLEGLIIKQLFF